MNVEIKISFWWKNSNGDELTQDQKDLLLSEAKEQVFGQMYEGFTSGQLISTHEENDEELNFEGWWDLKESVTE